MQMARAAQNGRLGRGMQGAMQQAPVRMREQPPRPQTYQDPSDVKSQAIDEVRHTYEYAEATSMGMNDQQAVIYALQQAYKPPKEDIGLPSAQQVKEAPGAIVDAGQSALGGMAPYLGLPQVSDDPNTNVVLGAPNAVAAPTPGFTPQEEAGMNQTAIEADNWERILKPQYQEVYPEELLNSEIARVEAEITRLEGTYASSMTGAGESTVIGAGPEKGQDILDEQLAAANLELQQLQAIRGALYGVPEPDKPWYRKAWEAIVGSPVGGFFNMYDMPSEFMRHNMGGWMIRMAATGNLQPGMVLATGPIGLVMQQMGSTLDPAEIERAYQEGGNAAVWEYAVGRYPELMGMNDVERAALLGGLDAAFDPLNAVGSVAAATKGIPVLGGLMKGADVGANLPGHLVIGGASKGADAVKGAPGVGKLFEPSQTAISREIGQQAEDLSGRLDTSIDSETGKVIDTTPKVPTIGGRPIEPATMGSFTGLGPEPSPTIGDLSIEPAGIGSMPEASLAGTTVRSAPIGSIPEASLPDPVRARPFYADETPFSDKDYAEYIRRIDAGEEPSAVIESIYARGDGGTPPKTSGSKPTATRDDPLADLAGETPSRPVPTSVDTTPSIPRPRYIDGTSFDDVDFTRYQNLVRSGENADDIIDAIRAERLTAQQAADAPAPPAPRNAPEPPTVGGAPPPPVVDGPAVSGSVADAPRAPEAPAPERPVNPAYANDPEIMDIPDTLKRTNSPELSKYGLKSYVQNSKGKWIEAKGRVKGGQFFSSGQKAWRQLIRTIEREVQDGSFARTADLPAGNRIVDQETAALVNRYIAEPDPKKAANILKIIDGPGRNSYVDEAGNRFVRKGDAAWQEMADGRRALEVIGIGGKGTARIIDNNGAYTILRGADEAPARIRSLGGLGDSANNPYVPELVERLKVAREQFHKPGSFDAATDVTPSSRADLQGKYADDSLGIVSRGVGDVWQDVKAGPLGRLGRTAERITKKDGRIEVVPEATYAADDELVPGSLGDDLYRVARISNEERAWLNTKIDAYQIRWENLTANQRKIATQVLGIDAGKGAKLRNYKETLEASVKDGLEMPTRGEVYEQLIHTMADESAEARLQVWKKIIGGERRANMNVGQAYRDSGAVAATRAAGRKTWAEMGAMVRHAILYPYARAINNTLQDAGTNHFVFMVDGQAGVNELHAKLMKDFFAEKERIKKLGKIATTDDVEGFRNTTIELRAMYEALDIPVPAIVSSAFGGKFDESLGRFIENSATWWSDMGEKIGGKPGRTIGSFFASPTVKEVRSANDDLMRQSASADYILRNYNQQYEEFIEEIRAAGLRGKWDADEAITRLQRKGSNIFGATMFSPEDVRTVINAYDPKRAENLSRRWRGRVSALNKGGTQNVTKNLFSYMPTRLDEQIGKVWMFHYWMTRASVQHARLALENPQLMATYVRTWQGMEKMKDRENLPSWARQYVSLMAGPYGMLGLVSPAAVLTGLAVVMDANGVLDDPSASSLLQLMPFHPIVQAAASVYLTERLPDPTGTNNTRQFAKAAINYLRNEMGVGSEGLTGDPLANLTYNLQGLARDIAPGATPLAAPSPGQKDTQIVKYYAAEIMRNTPDPENGGTLWQNPDGSITDYASQVMANIDAGLYSGTIEAEALDQFTTDTMAGRVAMTSIPIQSLYPSVIGDARLENRQGYQAENQPLQLDTTTSPDSMAFIDPSRAPTTTELGGSLAVGQGDAGSPVSASLVAALDQYSNIGSDDTKELYQNVNNAIYMTGDELRAQYGGGGIIINGERFAWEIWGALPDDARRTYMESWLKTKGRYEEIEAYRAEREAFEASHPEVGEFKRWQEVVGDKGGEAMLEILLSGRYPAFEAWWKTQDIKPAYIQRVLMTPSAYLASLGHEPNLWDINDISTKPTVDPNKASPLDDIAPKDTSNTGYGSDRPFDALTPEEKVARINEKLAVWNAEMDLFNQQIAPYTGGATFSQLGPSGIAVLEAIMQRQQITMPSMPSIVKDYVDWINLQPANADTSVSAYVAWLGDLAKAA